MNINLTNNRITILGVLVVGALGLLLSLIPVGKESFKAADKPAANMKSTYFYNQKSNFGEITMRSKTVTYNLEASPFQWELAPGKVIEAWGYNQQVPGPVLKARKGDTLVVIFKNNLEEPTTIHWHGLRIPSLMDGTEDVQKPVQPGETFEYRFVLPDAGTYWYHPHFNEPKQLERGLYGAIIVEDEMDPKMDSDRLFLIDDMKLTADHKFKQPSWFIARWKERHDGREGETLLVNGKEQPTISINAGQLERWRFINTSSARYLLLNLSGKPFQIISTDGGLLEQPKTAAEVLITPGERYDIVAGPFKEGETFAIEALPFNRGTKESKSLQFATVSVEEPRTSAAFVPEILRTIEPLAAQDAMANKMIKLHGKRSWKDGVDFTINDVMHVHDTPVRSGELQIWEISNPSMLDHPFHLHGFFFQVLEVNGQPPAFAAWKDTFNIPRGGSVKIAWMPDDRTGKWMYHCHILEHATAGMMAHFEVVSGRMAVDMTTGYSHHH